MSDPAVPLPYEFRVHSDDLGFIGRSDDLRQLGHAFSGESPGLLVHGRMAWEKRQLLENSSGVSMQQAAWSELSGSTSAESTR
jgi:hypothetical protein